MSCWYIGEKVLICSFDQSLYNWEGLYYKIYFNEYFVFDKNKAKMYTKSSVSMNLKIQIFV